MTLGDLTAAPSDCGEVEGVQVPWRCSRRNWIKPRATLSYLIDDTAVSRRLDRRHPDVPSGLSYSF